ncbi:hypothetical protein MKX03_022490 [Papaver bracteatum]|nr:hypothetical protein MKX03_022490 [Papaver bracteatum]
MGMPPILYKTCWNHVGDVVAMPLSPKATRRRTRSAPEGGEAPESSVTTRRRTGIREEGLAGGSAPSPSPSTPHAPQGASQQEGQGAPLLLAIVQEPLEHQDVDIGPQPMEIYGVPDVSLIVNVGPARFHIEELTPNRPYVSWTPTKVHLQGYSDDNYPWNRFVMFYRALHDREDAATSYAPLQTTIERNGLLFGMFHQGMQGHY